MMVLTNEEAVLMLETTGDVQAALRRAVDYEPIINGVEVSFMPQYLGDAVEQFLNLDSRDELPRLL